MPLHTRDVRKPGEYAVHHVAQDDLVIGLGDLRRLLERIGDHVARGVAAAQDHRDPTLLQDGRDGVDEFTAHIHVEQGRIDRHGADGLLGIGELGKRADDLAAEALQHILQSQCDE